MQYSTQAAWVGLDCAWNISLLGDFKQTRSSPELFPAANLMYFRVVGQPDHLTSWSISVSKRWPRQKSHWFILYPKGCSLISQKCVLNRASQDGGAQKRSSYELWVTILSGRYQFHSSVAILFYSIITTFIYILHYTTQKKMLCTMTINTWIWSYLLSLG